MLYNSTITATGSFLLKLLKILTKIDNFYYYINNGSFLFEKLWSL